MNAPEARCSARRSASQRMMLARIFVACSTPRRLPSQTKPVLLLRHAPEWVPSVPDISFLRWRLLFSQQRCKCPLSSVILPGCRVRQDNRRCGRLSRAGSAVMSREYRVIAAVGCLLASLCASAQMGERTRKIVLPNPQLIHCRSAECSQLWKQDSGDGGGVYPAQVFTDLVNGEVVGLTAVYDKSVSKNELRAAINTLYEKWERLDGLWRVKPERIVIQLSERSDGTKQLIYLKVSPDGSLVPSAHICSE